MMMVVQQLDTNIERLNKLNRQKYFKKHKRIKISKKNHSKILILSSIYRHKNIDTY
jgi:hypothetical protein